MPWLPQSGADADQVPRSPGDGIQPAKLHAPIGRKNHLERHPLADNSPSVSKASAVVRFVPLRNAEYHTVEVESIMGRVRPFDTFKDLLEHEQAVLSVQHEPDSFAVILICRKHM
jgi:hypothetical protein